MAKDLNKTRIRDSWLIACLCILLVFLINWHLPLCEFTHEIFETLGYILVLLCALGRIYATTFLGGFKNNMLVTYGPFSVVRNPLYLFSLIGVTGIAFISLNFAVMIVAPLAFLALYLSLIRREEKFLAEKFGDDYRRYCEKTPRLIPRFSAYNCPDEITTRPKLVLNAVLDALAWFIPFLILEWTESYRIPLLHCTT